MRKIKLDDFDDAVVQNVDLSRYVPDLYRAVDMVNNSEPRVVYLRRYETVHEKAILSLAREISDPRELRIALRPYFAHWQPAYLLLLKYIMSHGYRFKRMDEFRPGLSKKKFVFLRFDVHYRDLPGLYGFIDVNLALGVPANYYVQWDYSEVEFAARDDFLQLLKMEDESSRFGLHASPVDSWMIWDRFDGSEKRQSHFLDSAEGDEYIGSLKNDPKKLQETLGAAQEHFVALASNFLQHFPKGIGSASHGGKLHYVLRTRHNERRAREGGLRDDVWAQDFMNEDRVAPTKLEFNTNRMPRKYRFSAISDGTKDTRAYIDSLDNALARGGAIEALTHPGVLHRMAFDRDLLTELAARITYRRAGLKTKQHFFQDAESRTVNMTIPVEHNFEVTKGSFTAKISGRSELRRLIFENFQGNGASRSKHGKFRFGPIDCALAAGGLHRIKFFIEEIDENLSFKVQVDYRNAKGRRLPFSVRGKIRKADPYIDCLGRQPVAAIELVMIFAGAGKVVLEPLFEVASVAFPYVGKDARTFRSPANVLGSSEANLT